jgi:hypothetical protein
LLFITIEGRGVEEDWEIEEEGCSFFFVLSFFFDFFYLP